MNIIRDKAAPAQPTTAFLLEERHTTATGVERRVSVEPAGNNRHQAWQVLAFRVAQNPAMYAPHTGIRLVLVGGDR
jgi:hypothetical protein